jgi:phosphate transport system protein
VERHFERDLEDLKNTLVMMGEIVDSQLEDASEALFGGKRELVRGVIERDVAVDEFDTEIDRKCQKILALNQPVAIDLRLLMAALQINTQLERIGDIAVNLAERTDPLLHYAAFLHSTRLEEMAQIARIMVHDSVDAFVSGTAEQAARVLASDDVVDNLGREIFHSLVASMRENPELIEPGSHMLILIHHIERMADHATNIAEDVIFLVEARMVKHNAEGAAEM